MVKRQRSPNKKKCLTHKENSKKIREVITPILNTAELCAWKYSTERSQEHRKKDLEVGLEVILLTLEILQNYYNIELWVGLETLRTIFRISHECLRTYCFSSDRFCCFCGISRQPVMFISYGYLCICKITHCQ